MSLEKILKLTPTAYALEMGPDSEETGKLVSSIDGLVDAALASSEIDQAPSVKAILTALDEQMDTLMDRLGVYDPDEPVEPMELSATRRLAGA